MVLRCCLCTLWNYNSHYYGTLNRVSNSYWCTDKNTCYKKYSLHTSVYLYPLTYSLAPPQGAAALKPPRIPSATDTCAACAIERSRDMISRTRTAAPERGKDSAGIANAENHSWNRLGGGGGGGADAAGGANASTSIPGGAGGGSSSHTCGRDGTSSAFSISLNSHGMDRNASAAAVRQMSELEQQRPTRARAFSGEGDEGELTPVTVAGVGASLAAEHDTTPLLSRRSGASSRDLSPMVDGGGGAGSNSEDTPGHESSSTAGEGKRLKRKDTITWEAFLANFTTAPGEDSSGGTEAGTGGSESSSPADSRLHDGSARVSLSIVAGFSNRQ